MGSFRKNVCKFLPLPLSVRGEKREKKERAIGKLFSA